jgi:hypothetical protein
MTHSIVNSKITVISVLHLLDLLGARPAFASSPKNTSLPHLLVCPLFPCLTNKKHWICYVKTSNLEFSVTFLFTTPKNPSFGLASGNKEKVITLLIPVDTT